MKSLQKNVQVKGPLWSAGAGGGIPRLLRSYHTSHLAVLLHGCESSTCLVLAHRWRRRAWMLWSPSLHLPSSRSCIAF